MPIEWPLVGRREELVFIADALNSPKAPGVVLAGAPGVGKSRLAHEALRLAESKGLSVAWASGTQAAASLPFGAFAHLLPLEPLSTGPVSLRNVLRMAAEGLVERAGASRLVLIVDDAHLVDDASAALVEHVAAAGKAFVVAAVRAGESAPEAVVALWKEGLAERLEVQPLSRAEMEELVEVALGGQVDAGALYQLWKVTGGNPLFLREIVLGGREQNALVEAEGVWRWKGPTVAAPRVVEVIQARLGRLEPQDRALLEVVAEADLLGADLLQSLAPHAAIEAAQRRGLLEEWVDGRRRLLRLSHPLYAEVLRAQTPPSRTREIRRRLADALEVRGARRGADLMRVATWRLESGGPTRPEVFLPASSQAVGTGDFALGVRLARASVEAGGGPEASHLLAQALIGDGRFEEAEEVLASLQPEVQAEEQLVHTVNARAWNLFWHMGLVETALRLSAEAEATLQDPELRDQLRAARATFLVFAGRTQEAFDLVPDFLEGSRLTPGTVVWLVALGWGLSISGRPEEAIRLIDRQLEAAGELAGEAAVAHGPLRWLRASRAAAHMFAGRLLVAAAAVEDLYMESLELPNLWNQGALAWSLGLVRLPQGRIRTAMRLFREAAAIFREVDMFRQLPLCLGDLAQAEAQLGNAEAAEEALAEAETVRVPGLRGDELRVRLGYAWTAAARGEVSTGARLALEAAEVMRSMGESGNEAIALHDAARLGEARRVWEPLADLAMHVEGPIVSAYVDHARGLAERDAAGLEEASRSFEELGAMLLAAEAAAEAAGAHQDAGRKGSGLAWAARARTLADQCEDARTPALAQLELPLPLTRREREIAELAARGLTNREIAERLVVSVRTVDNHLHSAYGKLGLSGRAELSDVVSPPREPRRSAGSRET